MLTAEDKKRLKVLRERLGDKDFYWLTGRAAFEMSIEAMQKLGELMRKEDPTPLA